MSRRDISKITKISERVQEITILELICSSLVISLLAFVLIRGLIPNGIFGCYASSHLFF